MLRHNKCPQPNYPPTLKGYKWVYNERLNIWEEEPNKDLSMNDIRILNGLPPIFKSEPVNDASKIAKEILADIAGMTVDDTIDSITIRILFGEGVE